MEFLSEKFALKSAPSKNTDFYMGAGGALEHVMETLDNESFYSKASAGKCVQAFGPLARAEHHVRLERTSPCQDGGGESPARAAASLRQTPSARTDRDGPGGRKEAGSERAGGRRKAGGRCAFEECWLLPTSGCGGRTRLRVASAQRSFGCRV